MKTGGKQYRVQQGDRLQVELLAVNEGDMLDVSQILMASGDDGLVQVGNPFIEGAKVRLKVEKHGRGDKIIVFKYKAKKNYRKKQGHRQSYSQVVVEEIVLP